MTLVYGSIPIKEVSLIPLPLNPLLDSETINPIRTKTQLNLAISIAFRQRWAYTGAMQPIHTYNNGRKLLQDLVQSKLSQQPQLSQRIIAERASLSPSYFSRVLTGQRGLTLDSARRLAKYFKLSPPDSEYFLALLELEQAKSEKQKLEIQKRLARYGRDVHFLAPETFQIIADWYHFAIYCLTYTKGFRSDSQWIARRLQITRLEASVALEHLLKTGLIKLEDGVYRAVRDAQFETTPDISSLAARENHTQHLGLARSVLEDVPPEEREFINCTLSFHRSDLNSAKQRIREFVETFNQDFDREGGDDVYQVCVQFYPLTVKNRSRQ